MSSGSSTRPGPLAITILKNYHGQKLFPILILDVKNHQTFFIITYKLPLMKTFPNIHYIEFIKSKIFSN